MFSYYTDSTVIIFLILPFLHFFILINPRVTFFTIIAFGGGPGMHKILPISLYSFVLIQIIDCWHNFGQVK